MARITFQGMNTGLPPNIVERIIEAERIPVKNMENRKTKVQSRLTLVEELETKMIEMRKSIAELAGTRGFADIKLVSGNPNIVDGVVDPSTATSGSYNIEVVQLAKKASAITNGFPDKDKTELGIGYIKFETEEGTKEVFIDGENNTLSTVATKINRSGLGVQATVINDRKDPDEPFKLVLSGKEVGDENHIEYPTMYFLDGDQDIYWDEEREAENGIVKIDGFEMEIADNVLKDYIPGVTLNLKQSAPGKTVNITVKEDLEVVSGKIKSFVEGANQVLSFIQTQNRMDENTDTASTLGGDTLIRGIEARMRRLIIRPQLGIKGNVTRLSQLGIIFNRNGTLDFDQEKFNATLARNPDHVQSFFAGDGFNTGFIPSLKRTVSDALNQAFGPIAMRKRNLRRQIDRIDQRIETKERQLANREEALRRQFARLEETVSRFRSQGAAIGALGAGGGLPQLNLSGGGQAAG